MVDTIYVPLGQQCSAVDALNQLGLRTCSYPFDWHASPASNSLLVLRELFEAGVTAAAELMVHDLEPGHSLADGRCYTTGTSEGVAFFNTKTSFGILHYNPKDDGFQRMITRRLERMLAHVKEATSITLLYNDPSCIELQYKLNDKTFSHDATQDLLEIQALLKRHSQAIIKVLYFCWPSNLPKSSTADEITYVPFENHNKTWWELRDFIRGYLSSQNV